MLNITLIKSPNEVKVAQSCLTLCNPMEPARLLCPWNAPGQNTGVEWDQTQVSCMQADSLPSESPRKPKFILFMLLLLLSSKSYPTLCEPMNYSTPGPPSMGFPRQEY